MPVEVLRGFDEAFGTKVLEGYGLSETTGMGSFNLPTAERKPGSIGVPIGGTEFRLVDDDGNDVPAGEPGEIAMRGPFVMRGYWERDDATAETIRDGWFHTGDMATVDDDGYFFIVDRKKELIIRGGYNVYPREIEEVLYEHPAIREAAVVGVPHDALGEEVGGRDRAEGRRGRERGRDPRVRQGARGGLQVPAPGLVRRGAAEGPDRQGAQAGDRGAVTPARRAPARPARCHSPISLPSTERPQSAWNCRNSRSARRRLCVRRTAPISAIRAASSGGSRLPR